MPMAKLGTDHKLKTKILQDSVSSQSCIYTNSQDSILTILFCALWKLLNYD